MRWKPTTVLAFALLSLPAYGAARLALDATALPPDFKGDSIQETYKAWTPAPKGEFETTEQYQKRLVAPDSGQLLFFSAHAFPTYNADTQEYIFRIEQSGYIRKGQDLLSDAGFSIGIDRSSKREEKFARVEGIRLPITSTETERYLLAIPHKIPGNVEGESNAFKIRVPIEEAPALKNRMKLLWICKPRSGSEPATFSGHFYKAATLKRLDEEREHNYYLNVDLLSFWVYDPVTGRILKKFDQETAKQPK